MYINPRIIALYDEYTHAPLPRRVFLRRLARLAGGAAAAAALLPMLENAYAGQVSRDDPRLETGTLEYGGMRCYVARPKDAAAKRPAIVVIHENRGLTPHIEDVARRAALEGFLAVAPDLLSPDGGTPKDEDRAREMIAALDRRQTVANLVAVVDDLARRPEAGRIGCIGFCWGGGMANQLAVHAERIAAASPFYGQVPDALDVPRIKARLLLHYAERDSRINTGVPAYEGALKAAGIQHALHVYPGTDHAFHNDTAGVRYNRQAAELAWGRTMAFLKDALR
jgi:carboxymethylenebutenolidase